MWRPSFMRRFLRCSRASATTLVVCEGMQGLRRMSREPKGTKTARAPMLAAYPLDELDRTIIQLLQKSCRASNSSIAHQLGISEATVRKRIDRLVSEGVITMAAVVHPRRIGFSVVGLVAIKTEFGRYEAVAEE